METINKSLQEYIEESRDAVCIVRKDLVVYANAACQALFAQDIKGQRIDSLLPEIDPFLNADRYTTAVTVGSAIHTVKAMRTEEGLILTVFRRDQAGPGLTSGTLSQMRAEVFNLRMALDRMLPRDTENEDPHVRVLYHCYYSLLHLIKELADATALSKGETVCRMQTLDLTLLVRDLVDSVAFFMGDSAVSLTCRLPEEPCYVRGDRDKLQQILLILLNNSLQHTHPGDSVTVGLRQTARQCILSVDDTGEGMSGEELAWAFTPREAPPLTASNRAGLGLCIAYGLARLHAGTIVLQSEPGKGTKARLTLPVRGQLSFRDAPSTPLQTPEQILTELANVLPTDAYHPKHR